jgi:thiol:disulfide interchange protein DsbC
MKFRLLSAGLLSVAFSVCAFAEAPSADKKLTKAEITVKFKELSGWKADVTATEDSPVPGYYQVIANSRIYYVSDNGKHLFVGDLFDFNKQWVNHTEPRLQKERVAIIERDSSGYAEYKAKDEKHIIYVFTDPTCSYCKQLHNQMGQYNELGITVRYLAWPRGGIEDRNPVYGEMKKAWCSDDTVAAIDKLFDKERMANEQCDTSPVDRHFNLGKKFGVAGTPALILPGGKIQRGYVTPSKLIGLLNG